MGMAIRFYSNILSRIFRWFPLVILLWSCSRDPWVPPEILPGIKPEVLSIFPYLSTDSSKTTSEENHSGIPSEIHPCILSEIPQQIIRDFPHKFLQRPIFKIPQVIFSVSFGIYCKAVYNYSRD